jgi:immunoglobulin-like protein involved in spore germination
MWAACMSNPVGHPRAMTHTGWERAGRRSRWRAPGWFVAALLVATALAAVATASLAAPPRTVNVTALRIRLAEHPARVRVVVDFTDGRLGPIDAEAAEPDPFDGAARVDVRHRGIEARAPAAARFGVRVSVTEHTNRIAIHLGSPGRRFKYLAYLQLRNPDRVVIDLYKSAPPSRTAEIRRGERGCLALVRWSRSGSRIHVSGTARDIFENQFQALVRDAAGRVAGRATVTSAPSGRWTGTVTYTSARPQPGTLEAVDSSARDGSLACLAQVRVALADTTP